MSNLFDLTVALGDLKQKNKIISDTPAGRIGEPEDITGAM